MAKFAYMARDSNGTAVKGEIAARSDTEAVRTLRGEGKFVVKLSEVDEQAQVVIEMPKARGRRVKSDEIIYFANQLAGMVDSGVPLADALEATIDKSPAGA